MPKVSRVFAVASIACGILVYACSSDDPAPVTTPADGGSTPGPTPTDSGTPPPSDSGGGTDASADAPLGDGACNPTPPDLDAGGACGTVPFGTAEVKFGPVDVDAGNGYDGGVLPPGVYDIVQAERASGDGGAWRETFVVDGNGRFTRVRQVTARVTPGPVTRRSGTYQVRGNGIRLAYDCAFNDDAGVDGGEDTLVYDVVGTACEPRYRYGAAGIRVTLQRRRSP